VLLPTDRCPNEPETRNAYEDDDGCPDNPDADNDGVLLPADRCPEQPETRNEFEDTDGCPDTPPPVVLAGERITVNGTILFQTDRDRILPESFGLLDQVAAILQGHSEIRRIRIEGHTDNQGRARRNLALSRRRADAVERYLRDHGIDRDRLTSEGYGADRRIATGDTPEDHARNRRVEFYIVDPPGGVSATAAAAAAPPAAPAPDEERGRHRRHRREGGRRHHRRH
jgi:outer membrane protein OmpA-like peptidoglycan-associated protein